jgi:hypothetical protein
LPQTDDTAVVDVVLVVDVVCTGALDEVVLVDVVLGVCPVVDVVEGTLVEVVLGTAVLVDVVLGTALLVDVVLETGVVLVLVVLVVLVDVVPPTLDEVVDDVLVVDGGAVVDVVELPGVPRRTVTCPMRMVLAMPCPSSVAPCMSQSSPSGTQMRASMSARR